MQKSVTWSKILRRLYRPFQTGKSYIFDTFVDHGIPNASTEIGVEASMSSSFTGKPMTSVGVTSLSDPWNRRRIVENAQVTCDWNWNLFSSTQKWVAAWTLNMIKGILRNNLSFQQKSRNVRLTKYLFQGRYQRWYLAIWVLR